MSDKIKNIKKYKILIIDDEKSNIAVLTDILNKEYKVSVVRNSLQALATAQKNMPDVILLDIVMPDKDGYEVIKELKESAETRNIPVIFITGLDNTEAEEKGLRLGAADYIFKPFGTAIVKLRIKNQIKLLEQLRQQSLMARITNSFLSASHIDTLLKNTLHMVGEFMDVEQILLFMLEDEKGTIACHSEWTKPESGLESRVGSVMKIKEPLLSVIKGMLTNDSGNLCIHSNDPYFKKAMLPYRKNFHNYIITPIFAKGEMCAVLDFSKSDDGEQWSESEISLAGLVSGVFSGVFERNAIEHDLSIVLKLKDELITAKEQAEHLGRAKSEFLSRMSHEMLTPMNAIKGIIQIVEMNPAKACDYLDEMSNAFEYLLELIHSVLDTSDMEHGVFKLSETDFDVKKMLKQVLSKAKNIAKKKKQLLKSYIDSKLPEYVIGDEKRIEQIISNMLANAVKFTPEKGEIHFTVSMFNENEPLDSAVTLQIEVADNGTGIPEEKLESIFELFEQGDGSNTRIHTGIGIGLPLSRRIAEMMGGSITVESQLEKGSTFTFICKFNKGAALIGE